MTRSLFSAFICVLLLPLSSLAQEAPKTIAERLGYPRDAKLVIVHADDLGMSHSVNAATIKAFETGLVNSGSIMVPCPWLSEIATYARANPHADLGLHLTLTSEWTSFRWGPVSPRDRVTSLLDKDGYFRLTETEAARPTPSGYPVQPGVWRLPHGNDPTLPLDDLEPLRQVIGNASVVGLGETIHTSGGYYRMKHRAFRFLVERMGFRVFAFESPWENAEKATTGGRED